jgi:type IX secretion system PorP/SprF family membrane protein
MLLSGKATAQGLHFSQYNNAPMLLNPANTGLMPYSDYRIGVNYRNQWASIPAPFRTTSAFADFGLMRYRNKTNWLGLGLAIFDDRVGDGNLALTRADGFIAYHIMLNEKHAISAGGSVGYAQRSVDYSKLRFDAQWDGKHFSPGLANNEPSPVAKTYFADVNVGINYAYIPDENLYLKIGIGLSHVNQPSETFYSTSSVLDMRPIFNGEAFIKTDRNVILNPSLYFSMQDGAYEIMYGSQALIRLGFGMGEMSRHQLILGAYNRWNDAIVPVFGYQYKDIKLTTSYDFTISKGAALTKGSGGYEVSIIYLGLYDHSGQTMRMYSCPGFTGAFD